MMIGWLAIESRWDLNQRAGKSNMLVQRHPGAATSVAKEPRHFDQCLCTQGAIVAGLIAVSCKYLLFPANTRLRTVQYLYQ